MLVRILNRFDTCRRQVLRLKWVCVNLTGERERFRFVSVIGAREAGGGILEKILFARPSNMYTEIHRRRLEDS